ncbi:MAG: lantibiotic dehydratase [Kofleriaceae bacterium]
MLAALSQFVVRTPVLPFDVLARWADQPDRRQALRSLVEDPIVREALYVASPELDAQIAAWLREPETQAGIAVERALVRYVSRMAGRSTPFGLFSAVSVGSVGETTRLAVPSRAAAHRHTRLDNDFLFALCADLARDPEVRQHLRFRTNSSLYAAAGRLRYAEARLAGPVRTYHLVAVDRTAYLEALLARARDGATLAELVAALVADPQIAADEATAFIFEVLDAQLIVAELAPAVTGREPTLGIIDTLATPELARFAEPLRAAYAGLQAIDVAAPGVAADRYRAIETLLADLPTKAEPSRLFQVDLFKPATIELGEPVIAELRAAIELLHGLAPSAGDSWARFRDKFTARYETREVPLVEVLDEEVGIGFGDDSAGGNSLLLADLAFPLRGEAPRVELGARALHLMSLVAHALRSGATEIELSDDDVAKLSARKPTRLPDTVSAGAILVAESAEAVAAGEFSLRIQHVGGGANLLGRFCHGSPEVAALTERALRAEEAMRPDAVFAEIVHLPEGRLGNVLLRPVLRGYEIPFLGTSGADADHQIGIQDLVISVVENRVVLRSRRLGCEVIPRMTTAHNYSSRSLTVYRFLCSHAQQGVGHAYWSWGAIADFPFLPRVRRGKLILDRARWLATAKDLAPIEAAFTGSNAAKTPDQIRAIRTKVAAAMTELRKRLALPRWIVIGDGDNELPVDLDNELMVDSAAQLLKGRSSATLYELLPAPDQLAMRGPEGAFTHELIALFARTSEPARRAPVAAMIDTTPRRFLPGSPWLYLKIYTGTATADALLKQHLAPAIETARATKLATSWFFLRYGDPDWHLRLRFTGDPQTLTSQLLPLLHAAIAPACDQDLVWKVVVDTYEREVERYGGPGGIELAEQLFHADSEAALAIVRACEGDAGTEAAWRVTLRGIDQLMDDLGLALADKHVAMTAARDAFGAELGMDTAFQKRLGDKFRAHGKEIAALLAAPANAPDHPYAPALEAFSLRSLHLRPLGHRLRALATEGRLNQPVNALVQSYIHMHVNRLIRSSQRAHELVLYDLLRRHYDGQIARTKPRLQQTA